MSEQRSSAAVGWTVFASVALFLLGTFQFLAGLSAIAKDGTTLWVPAEQFNYFITLDTSAWGWTHLIIGIIVFLAGIGVLAGQVWARTVGVIIAALSMIANFLFIPIYPWWAITMLVVGGFVIWALTAHGRDITKPAD